MNEAKFIRLSDTNLPQVFFRDGKKFYVTKDGVWMLRKDMYQKGDD